VLWSSLNATYVPKVTDDAKPFREKSLTQ
jgi:hypothetical protein